MALRLKFDKVMVKDGTTRITNAESTIVQQAEQIALKVAQSSFNALSGRMDTAESSITQQANQIASKVASTDYNGAKIASLINQTAAEIKIQASHIQLEGIVTANSFFKILADGSIEAVNAKLSGAITATKMVSPGNADLYGEIGATDGNVGLGLYDKRYSAEPFMKIVETYSGGGFSLKDRNEYQRIIAGTITTALRDAANKERLGITVDSVNIRDALERVRITVSPTSTVMVSPTGKIYMVMTDDVVQIVKNGVTIQQFQ